MGLDNESSLPGSPEVTPVIEFEAVSKWYGNFQVLTDCTTQVAKGDVVVVCGGGGVTGIVNVPWLAECVESPPYEPVMR